MRMFKIYFRLEFPLWLSGLRIWHFLYKDAGWSPGLPQWIKDQVLLWLWLRTYLQLWFDLWPQNLHMPQVQLLKKKKRFTLGIPLQHSRLRNQHCHCSGLGCFVSWIQSLARTELPHAADVAKKKKKKIYFKLSNMQCNITIATITMLYIIVPWLVDRLIDWYWPHLQHVKVQARDLTLTYWFL